MPHSFLPGRFTGYELAPVVEIPGEGCVPQESLETAEALPDRVFWSLYGHLPDGGVSIVGDYDDYVGAAETYSRITGWVVPANPDGRRLLRLPAGS